MFYNINIRWYNIVVKNIGVNMDKKLVKNYIYSVLYQLLLVFTPFITTPYLTRVLGL